MWSTSQAKKLTFCTPRRLKRSKRNQLSRFRAQERSRGREASITTFYTMLYNKSRRHILSGPTNKFISVSAYPIFVYTVQLLVWQLVEVSPVSLEYLNEKHIWGYTYWCIVFMLPLFIFNYMCDCCMFTNIYFYN